jgi:hypothetical protein
MYTDPGIAGGPPPLTAAGGGAGPFARFVHAQRAVTIVGGGAAYRRGRRGGCPAMPRQLKVG